MGRTVAIGLQRFSDIREGNYFYVDKTSFIKEWWESGDSVTLITRPRRFGKTLNMSMLEQFFSVKYANRGDLFEGLSIWQEKKYEAVLLAKGIQRERIKKYGFAFEGKVVLIGSNDEM